MNNAYQNRPPLLAPLLFVDREGDIWRSAGFDARGDERLVCDEPQNADDRGTGPSFPWTRTSVESWFGPLVRYEVVPAVAPTAIVMADGTVLYPVVAA